MTGCECRRDASFLKDVVSLSCRDLLSNLTDDQTRRCLTPSVYLLRSIDRNSRLCDVASRVISSLLIL
jgi:hypothetical protein